MLFSNFSNTNRFISAKQITGFAMVFALLTPFAAQAENTNNQTSADAATSQTKWGLGVGAMSSQKPYTNMDRDNLALPLVYIENDWIRVFGLSAELKVYNQPITDSQNLDFRLLARLDGSGYESDDADILDGMDKRKGGLWTGAKVTWHNEFIDVSTDWQADTSGDSDGQMVNIGLEKTWRVTPKVMLTPRFTTSWMNDKYVDYYFGVKNSEANSDRAAHQGDAAINTELGARATYIVDKQQSVLLDVGVTFLADEIQDSPLVDSSTTNKITLGYLYRF
ncbi:MipA/OmpV family protein [Marinomonas sp. A3A]|jgi:outer membrane protein|uniref:MipA/OmpV family protein n=1 Tax=Marinomonas sp. A3A TaxID=2065312 RepID=UPI001BB436C3|nr:MipA/OmpV family protein [Marinomonas sp. A3A]